ncbi:hypothetical protein SI65_02788 [Aspergillus cristatus]|uniref:Uncharacterized protein n=1 Tax=Aspergillus cristatus TaxID=573508 RepID=A0A1E3BLV8_ASPCR|nr:hypothetical protein SI65_02788 [Aspergillus cristatus]
MTSSTVRVEEWLEISLDDTLSGIDDFFFYFLFRWRLQATVISLQDEYRSHLFADTRSYMEIASPTIISETTFTGKLPKQLYDQDPVNYLYLLPTPIYKVL